MCLNGEQEMIPATEPNFADAKQAFEVGYFRGLIKTHGPNVRVLARISGLERTHLYRKLRGLGLTIGKQAEEAANANMLAGVALATEEHARETEA